MPEAAPLPGPLRLAPMFPFAGRARERATLRALLPRTADEGRRAALVAGEPGSGKSRLVRELAHDVAPEGAIVLYGACDAVVASPYGPFVAALEHIVRQTDAADLRRHLGATGGELRRLLPDLPAKVGELPEPITADADTERHRLHTAVTDLLRSLGESAPVLLVLEDVHWADAPTLQLVRHLVRSGADLRMLVVATFRDAEADVPAELSEALVDVQRTEGVMRMRLGGLSSDEVAEFVRLAAGVEEILDVAVAIDSLTDGNAFLVTELWRELIEDGAVEVGPAGLRLSRPLAELGTPETVREVVSHRLSRLAPATIDLLELAAVVGAELDLGTLRRAASLDEGVLLDAIDEAVRNGLVVETRGRRLAYRFTHELVRRSVADRLSASGRAESHLRIAESIEAEREVGERGAGLAALAYHYAAAAPLGGEERAITYNLLAAESAADALAFDEAAERFGTALALGILDPRERAGIGLRQGEVLHRGGRSAEALRAFAHAAELARELADAELLARAAIGFEETCWRPGIHDAGSVELLEEAKAALPAVDSELLARVLAGLARALDFQGESIRAAHARDASIAMSRRLGDQRGLAWTLAASYWSRGLSTNEEINRMLVEAREISEELGDLEIRSEALSWLVPSHVVDCDHVAARRALRELFDAAERIGQPFPMHVAEHYASTLALCDGDLAEAERAALRSCEWSRLLTGRDASGVYGIQMFGIRREQGRLSELAPAIRMLSADGSGAWGPGLVAVLAELGMQDEARSSLARILDEGLDALRASLWLASLAYLADGAAALRDAATAAAVYPELERYAGSNLMVGHLVACYGAVDRYLGACATVLGDWDRAETHFESALALNARLGARTWLAHTAYHYARMLLARRDTGDRARASAQLRTSLALATEIGMPALAARIRTLDVGLDTAAVQPDGMTAREVEILTHVARGMSNRDVGRELHLSEHTVANHVRAILRKTGCANRTEAAAYAHRQGLVIDR